MENIALQERSICSDYTSLFLHYPFHVLINDFFFSSYDLRKPLPMAELDGVGHTGRLTSPNC